MDEKIPAGRETSLQQATVQEELPRESPAPDQEPSRTVPRLNTSPLHGLWALTKRDLKKWYTNPYQLLISLIQPAVWLGLFGKAVNFGSFISAGGGSPAQQNAILLGMDTSQITVLGVLGSFVLLFLMAMGLSSLFVMLALRSSNWQTQMAIINLLNLPLLFASNALFPTKLMPAWLRDVVKVNPVSYANDGVRQLLLGAIGVNSLFVDFAYLIGFASLFSIVGIVLSWRLLSK